jgi:transcriptional regulator with XRE-family HTH domain
MGICVLFESMSDISMPETDVLWLLRLKEDLIRVVGNNRNMYREVADVLGLSQESVYRRFRGDSMFTVSEIRKLAKNYPIDIGVLLDQPTNGHIGFSSFYTGPFDINTFLTEVYHSISSVQNLVNARLYCLAADIPIFRLMAYPALAQFKSVYWRQLAPGLSKTPVFTFNPATRLPLVKEITGTYKRLNVHEVWSVNTLRSTLSQIEYYIDNRLVPNANDAYLLYRDVKILVRDVFKSEEKWLELYQYELALHNNAFLVDGEQREELTLAVNSMNSLITKDKQMIKDFKDWLAMVMSRSVRLNEQSRKAKTVWLADLMGQIKSSYEPRLEAEYVEMLE